MATQSPEVKLPGKLFRKKSRWWWTVQLPGEARPRSRALKPEGSRVATTDRRQAQEIAFAMWEQAVRTETEAKVKDIEEKIKTLQEMKHALLHLIDQCDGHGTVNDCPIIEALEK